MRKIFISYRRRGDATAGYAGQIHSFLESKLGPDTVFRDLDSPISLAFLERYPSPVDAHRLGEKTLARFPRWSVEPSELVPVHTTTVRGFSSVPIHLD